MALRASQHQNRGRGWLQHDDKHCWQRTLGNELDD